MFKTTFAGHPLHPQLISIPLGLLPFSTAMDIAHLATGDSFFERSAKTALAVGLAGVAAAGAAGAVDYLAIPNHTETKKVANVHAGMNLLSGGLYLSSLALRQRGAHKAATIFSVFGTAALAISGWFGGHLVYHHGVRVDGVEGLKSARDWPRVPSGETIQRSLAAVAEKAPEVGLTA